MHYLDRTYGTYLSLDGKLWRALDAKIIGQCARPSSGGDTFDASLKYVNCQLVIFWKQLGIPQDDGMMIIWPCRMTVTQPPFFSCHHMYTNIKSLGTSSTLSPRPTACGVAFQSWQKPAGIPHVWIRLLYFISSNFNHMHSFGNRVHLPVDIKHPSTCNRGRVVGQHLSWLCVCHANLTPWYTPTDSLITLFIDGSTCKIRFGMPVTKVRRRGMCHVIKRRCSSALSQSGTLVFIWSFSNGDIGVYRLFFYSSKIKFRISYWL